MNPNELILNKPYTIKYLWVRVSFQMRVDFLDTFGVVDKLSSNLLELSKLYKLCEIEEWKDLPKEVKRILTGCRMTYTDDIVSDNDNAFNL